MMSEERAVAILMANLKGSKNKPSNLLDVAHACRLLIRKWGIKEVSRYFDTSEYMLRQIDKINELNPALRKLVSDGRLKIEASYHLWRLNEPKRSQAAKIIKNLKSDEIRTFIHFLTKYPEKSVSECKKLFEKTKPAKIKILVIPLETETFNDLQTLARKTRLNVHDFALKILENHMYGKKKK